MSVVADAGPLIALADIRRLRLLASVYGRVWIPPAVDREAFRGRRRHRPDWIVVQALARTDPQPLLALKPGSGERAALALALERHADLLLVDDRKARSLAARLGLPLAGTLASLLEAQRRGALDLVAPVLDALLSHGFRASDRLVAEVRKLAREA